MKKIIYLLLSCCMYSCLYADFESTIDVRNNSTHDVSYYLGLDGDDGTLYPDTTLTFKNFTWNIPKGTSYVLAVHAKSWKEVYNWHNRDTLCLFLIDTDTISKYGWDKVRDEYKVLIRYDLSLQDLKKLNYKIYYPPSPEMQKMRMYPR